MSKNHSQIGNILITSSSSINPKIKRSTKANNDSNINKNILYFSKDISEINKGYKTNKNRLNIFHTPRNQIIKHFKENLNKTNEEKNIFNTNKKSNNLENTLINNKLNSDFIKQDIIKRRIDDVVWESLIKKDIIHFDKNNFKTQHDKESSNFIINKIENFININNNNNIQNTFPLNNITINNDNNNTINEKKNNKEDNHIMLFPQTKEINENMRLNKNKYSIDKEVRNGNLFTEKSDMNARNENVLLNNNDKYNFPYKKNPSKKYILHTTQNIVDCKFKPNLLISNKSTSDFNNINGNNLDLNSNSNKNINYACTKNIISEKIFLFNNCKNIKDVPDNHFKDNIIHYNTQANIKANKKIINSEKNSISGKNNLEKISSVKKFLNRNRTLSINTNTKSTCRKIVKNNIDNVKNRIKKESKLNSLTITNILLSDKNANFSKNSSSNIFARTIDKKLSSQKCFLHSNDFPNKNCGKNINQDIDKNNSNVKFYETEVFNKGEDFANNNINSINDCIYLEINKNLNQQIFSKIDNHVLKKNLNGDFSIDNLDSINKFEYLDNDKIDEKKSIEKINVSSKNNSTKIEKININKKLILKENLEKSFLNNTKKINKNFENKIINELQRNNIDFNSNNTNNEKVFEKERSNLININTYSLLKKHSKKCSNLLNNLISIQENLDEIDLKDIKLESNDINNNTNIIEEKENGRNVTKESALQSIIDLNLGEESNSYYKLVNLSHDKKNQKKFSNIEIDINYNNDNNKINSNKLKYNENKQESGYNENSIEKKKNIRDQGINHDPKEILESIITSPILRKKEKGAFLDILNDLKQNSNKYSPSCIRDSIVKQNSFPISKISNNNLTPNINKNIEKYNNQSNNELTNIENSYGNFFNMKASFSEIFGENTSNKKHFDLALNKKYALPNDNDINLSNRSDRINKINKFDSNHSKYNTHEKNNNHKNYIDNSVINIKEHLQNDNNIIDIPVLNDSSNNNFIKKLKFENNNDVDNYDVKTNKKENPIIIKKISDIDKNAFCGINMDFIKEMYFESDKKNLKFDITELPFKKDNLISINNKQNNSVEDENNSFYNRNKNKICINHKISIDKIPSFTTNYNYNTDKNIKDKNEVIIYNQINNKIIINNINQQKDDCLEKIKSLENSNDRKKTILYTSNNPNDIFTETKKPEKNSYTISTLFQDNDNTNIKKNKIISSKNKNTINNQIFKKRKNKNSLNYFADDYKFKFNSLTDITNKSNFTLSSIITHNTNIDVNNNYNFTTQNDIINTKYNIIESSIEIKKSNNSINNRDLKINEINVKLNDNFLINEDNDTYIKEFYTNKQNFDFGLSVKENNFNGNKGNNCLNHLISIRNNLDEDLSYSEILPKNESLYINKPNKPNINSNTKNTNFDEKNNQNRLFIPIYKIKDNNLKDKKIKKSPNSPIRNYSNRYINAKFNNLEQIIPSNTDLNNNEKEISPCEGKLKSNFYPTKTNKNEQNISTLSTHLNNLIGNLIGNKKPIDYITNPVNRNINILNYKKCIDSNKNDNEINNFNSSENDKYIILKEDSQLTDIITDENVSLKNFKYYENKTTYKTDLLRNDIYSFHMNNNNIKIKEFSDLDESISLINLDNNHNDLYNSKLSISETRSLSEIQDNFQKKIKFDSLLNIHNYSNSNLIRIRKIKEKNSDVIERLSDDKNNFLNIDINEFKISCNGQNIIYLNKSNNDFVEIKEEDDFIAYINKNNNYKNKETVYIERNTEVFNFLSQDYNNNINIIRTNEFPNNEFNYNFNNANLNSHLNSHHESKQNINYSNNNTSRFNKDKSKISKNDSNNFNHINNGYFINNISNNEKRKFLKNSFFNMLSFLGKDIKTLYNTCKRMRILIIDCLMMEINRKLIDNFKINCRCFLDLQSKKLLFKKNKSIFKQSIF